MRRNEEEGSRIALLAVLVLIGVCSLYAIMTPDGGHASTELSAGALLTLFNGR